MAEIKKTAAKAPKPTPQKSTPAKSAAKYHTVKPGETLYSIAKKYNLTVDDLKRRNKITVSTIHPGDKLRISP